MLGLKLIHVSKSGHRSEIWIIGHCLNNDLCCMFCYVFTSPFICGLGKASLKRSMILFLIFPSPLSDDVYGFPGHPVNLVCNNATVNGIEGLEWRYDCHKNSLVAKGVYMDGKLRNAAYYSQLVGGRAKLSPDGSLSINRYEDKDNGAYVCDNGYRTTLYYLTTFSK